MNFDNPNMCRLCLQIRKPVQDIQSIRLVTRALKDIFDIRSYNGFPSRICSICEEKISGFYPFFMEVMNNQGLLMVNRNTVEAEEKLTKTKHHCTKKDYTTISSHIIDIKLDESELKKEDELIILRNEDSSSSFPSQEAESEIECDDFSDMDCSYTSEDTVNDITAKSSVVIQEDIKNNAGDSTVAEISHDHKVFMDKLKTILFENIESEYFTVNVISSPSTIHSSEFLDNNFSDDSQSLSEPSKKRGRPAVPVESLKTLNNLSPQEFEYRERRNKNNEACRRSRNRRREMEIALDEELRKLEVKNQTLIIEAQARERECKKYRKLLIKLKHF